MASKNPIERPDASAITRVVDLCPSPHLSSEDLLGPDGEYFELDLTIKSWDFHPVGVDEEIKGVIYFEERKRGLVINRGNAKMLAKLHGNSLSDLKGKRITLYVNPDVQYPGGQRGPGLRIKSKVPVGAATSSDLRQKQTA